MLGLPRTRRLDEPIAVSLEGVVPQDHFYRHLETKLDLAFSTFLDVPVPEDDPFPHVNDTGAFGDEERRELRERATRTLDT